MWTILTHSAVPIIDIHVQNMQLVYRTRTDQHVIPNQTCYPISAATPICNAYDKIRDLHRYQILFILSSFRYISTCQTGAKGTTSSTVASK